MGRDVKGALSIAEKHAQGASPGHENESATLRQPNWS